jgi:hypothetical protein
MLISLIDYQLWRVRMPRLISGAEILAKAEEYDATPAHGEMFGNWKYNAHRRTLDNGYIEVDLDRITSPEAALYEIFRFSQKRPRILPGVDLGTLIRALERLIRTRAGVSTERLETLASRHPSAVTWHYQ